MITKMTIDIKEHVKQVLNKFRVPENGRFAYRGRDDDCSSMVASCDAALCLYCIDELNPDYFIPWSEYINSFQNAETGWFWDDQSVWVAPYRLDPWLFGFALRTLNSLRSQPKFNLQFLDVWDTPEKMREWIFAGKGIMHLAIIWFGSGKKYYPFDNFEDTFFSILEQYREHFVPDRPAFTQVMKNRDPALAKFILKDAFHNLFAWYSSNREIPQKKLYIDWFLNEQNENGLFFQESPSSVYSHMDGIQLTIELSQRTDYRKDDCIRAVARGLDAIFDEKNFDLFWNVDWVHILLASCETIAQAVRVLPKHPLAQYKWNCVWDLKMWHLNETFFK